MEKRWILQFCHCHYGPFLDVARQYAALFKDSPYKVLTVYLTGEDTLEARAGSASDDVIFLGFNSRQIGGLKWQAIQALRKILQSRDFSLIIAHRFKPIYIACLAGKLPVIGVHHGFGDYDRAPRRWFANWFRQRILLLGVSNAVRDNIRQHLPAWPVTRIQTLYNRINPAALRSELLDRTIARHELELPSDVFIIGNVGRLHPDKDQATLIRGFALAYPKLPSGSLLAIMGSGNQEAPLKALAEQLGVAAQVRFLGQIPNGRCYFRAFDLFVLSSDHEPFGMVLLEAMAAGIPTMATNCGGAPEIVADRSMLFEFREADDLACKLSSFFRQTLSLRVSSCEAAERLENTFSDEAARQRFFTLPIVKRLTATSVDAST